MFLILSHFVLGPLWPLEFSSLVMRLITKRSPWWNSDTFQLYGPFMLDVRADLLLTTVASGSLCVVRSV